MYKYILKFDCRKLKLNHTKSHHVRFFHNDAKPALLVSYRPPLKTTSDISNQLRTYF